MYLFIKSVLKIEQKLVHYFSTSRIFTIPINFTLNQTYRTFNGSFEITNRDSHFRALKNSARSIYGES